MGIPRSEDARIRVIIVKFRFTDFRIRQGLTRIFDEENHMKAGIHPEYVETTVTCTCGNSFQTRSTSRDGSIHADVCSACHPFYTGKQKILDTGGRVAKFDKRYGTTTTIDN